MAIVDYSTLQASVASWLARADLTATIPDFISLAEARINRDLRVRKMQKVRYGLASSGRIPLPDDYIGMVSFKASYLTTQQMIDLDLNGDFILDGSELLDGENPTEPFNAIFEVFPQSRIANPPYSAAGGVASGYTVIGSEIRLIAGPGNAAYTMTYWAKVPALSGSAQQNWLLSDEPGLYLYAALIEASPFIGDDERTVLWATQFKSIIDRMNGNDGNDRYGNAPATMLLGATP